MPEIGIIDSGIEPAAGIHWSAFSRFELTDSGVCRVVEDATDKLGHGTAVAGIIQAGIASHHLHIARIFNDRLVTTPAQAAAAIAWLLEEDVHMINMSFGLQADRDSLREACRRAVDQGVILIAAAPVRGGPIYPAAYPDVIRATGDARCQPDEISWLNSPQADFGGHVRTPDAGPDAGPSGASIGCAWISRAAVRILADTPAAGREEIIEHLKSQAAYTGIEQLSTG